jgi:N-acetylmuramoyl-L-alanine amidase
MSIIVLDPGHSDYTHQFPGGYREGVLARKTGLAARDMLEKQGHKVLLTRTKPDEDPSLKSRGCLAVNNNAKIFVSIHTDASSGGEQTSASGVYGIFYAKSAGDTWGPDNQIAAPNGRKLAQMVAQEVAQALGLPTLKSSNKGAKVWWRCPSNLGVLTGCSNWNKTEAACLIEAGYGDNPNDRKKLSAPDAHLKYALGICRGIYRYANWEMPKEWEEGVPIDPIDPVGPIDPPVPTELDEAIDWMIGHNISDGTNIKNNDNLKRVAIWLKRFDAKIGHLQPSAKSFEQLHIPELDDAIAWSIKAGLSDGNGIRGNTDLERTITWIYRYNKQYEKQNPPTEETPKDKEKSLNIWQLIIDLIKHLLKLN